MQAAVFHHTLENVVLAIVVIEVLEIKFFEVIGVEDITIKMDRATKLQMKSNMLLISKMELVTPAMLPGIL